MPKASAVLEHFGIHEAAMDVRWSVRRRRLARRTPDGIEAFMIAPLSCRRGLSDRPREMAYRFAGKIESGLFTMMAIVSGQFAVRSGITLTLISLDRTCHPIPWPPGFENGKFWVASRSWKTPITIRPAHAVPSTTGAKRRTSLC